jgi:lipopolysaccharide/colanic/teichoic acid biosynthesis glycosyltransferase
MVTANSSFLSGCGQSVANVPQVRTPVAPRIGRRPAVSPRPARADTAFRPVPAERVSLVGGHLAAGVPIVRPDGNPNIRYRAAKRLLDVAGALGLLAVLGPVMLVILFVLCVTTRGKPLFWQRRAGYLGRTFRLVKFRTMRPDAATLQHTVKNETVGPVFKNRRDPRVTRIGRFLRKTSLDETPQLLHVLLGQMSLVGPRPLDVNELACFEAWQRRRLAVRPGLTCLWQVAGRSEVAFEDWMRMDLWYVRNQSLWTDCELLLRTPWSVLAGKGAY